MAVNIGINIQRSPNRINQNLREAGALGKYPKLLLDFKDEYYLANGGSKTFANAVTHARAGNATMTDGYGPELVVNGGFDSDVSGWTTYGDAATTVVYENGRALVDGATTNDGVYQTITVEPNKTYIFEADIERQSATGVLLASNADIPTNVQTTDQKTRISGQFSTTTGTSVSIRITNTNTSTGTFYVDNVSVREMPVIKWAPHNLLTYSEFDSETPTTWSVGFGTGTFTHTLGSEISNLPTITQEQTTSGRSYLTQNVTLKANTTYTLKLLVDEALSSITSGNNKILSANISGASGTLSASIDDVVDGNASITFTTGSTTSGTIRAGIGVLNSAVGTVVFAAPHLYRSDLGGMVDNPERGDSYVPTTSAAKYLPRVGHHVYNGSAWANEGLLAESEARTNLITQSNEFDGTDWDDDRLTITPDSAVSPDGTENAYKLAQASGQTQSGYINQPTNSTSGNSYVASVYAKAGTNRDYIAFVETMASGSAGYSYVDLTTGTAGTVAAAHTVTVQDVGNGWYRVAFQFDCTSSQTGGVCSFRPIETDGSTTVTDDQGFIYVYGAQLEQASTPSSFIPTSGSSVTRAAETFTIPSANLPWPTPQYIGSELVVNGDFSSWTTDDPDGWNYSGTVSPEDASNFITEVSGKARIVAGGTNNVRISQSVSTTVGAVYYVSVDVTAVADPQIVVEFGSLQIVADSVATFTGVFVATATSTNVIARSSTSTDVTFDNISVREINPLSVSIGMEGAITYADEGIFATSIPQRWFDSATNKINWELSTNSTDTGKMFWIQNDWTQAARNSGDVLSPDVLVPFNMASRHGSTFINGASDGVTATVNTTPTSLPDLSSADLNLAYDYMGTISEFRVWDKDIGDDGIVEATNPSLEPSLSLTFEGTGTNSFTVSDWSE